MARRTRGPRRARNGRRLSRHASHGSARGLGDRGPGDAKKTAFGTRPVNSQNNSSVQALHAELSGSNTCTALGIAARGSTPVLILCRQLLAAGLDPDRAMEVFRGTTPCLRICSIGEAAALEINGDGTGFRPSRQPDAASSVRSFRRGAEAQP
jgi:hypothetical protein